MRTASFFSGFSKEDKNKRALDLEFEKAELVAFDEEIEAAEQRLEKAEEAKSQLDRKQTSLDNAVQDKELAIDKSEAPRPLLNTMQKWIVIGLLAMVDIYLSTARMDDLGMSSAVPFAIGFSIFAIVLAHLLGKGVKMLKSPERPVTGIRDIFALVVGIYILLGAIVAISTPQGEGYTLNDQITAGLYTLCLYSLIIMVTAIATYHSTDIDPERLELLAVLSTLREKLEEVTTAQEDLVRGALLPAERKLKIARADRRRCAGRIAKLKSQFTQGDNVFSIAPGATG